jgi:hypothetical protein
LSALTTAPPISSLHLENVVELAVISFRPQVVAVVCPYELRRHAQVIARLVPWECPVRSIPAGLACRPPSGLSCSQPIRRAPTRP